MCRIKVSQKCIFYFEKKITANRQLRSIPETLPVVFGFNGTTHRHHHVLLLYKWIFTGASIPKNRYHRTRNDWISLVLNQHNLTFYLAIGRSHQTNQHQRWWVLITENQTFFQTVVQTRDESWRALGAPTHTPLFASIISGSDAFNKIK